MGRVPASRVAACALGAATLAVALAAAAGLRAAGEAVVAPPNAGGTDSVAPNGTTARTAAGTQAQGFSEAASGSSFLGSSVPPSPSGPPMGWVVY